MSKTGKQAGLFPPETLEKVAQAPCCSPEQEKSAIFGTRDTESRQSSVQFDVREALDSHGRIS
jgi:hypothetical protein